MQRGSLGAVARALGQLALLTPGILLVYLSFNAGGFFPGATGAAAAATALVLALRIAFAARPLPRLSVPLVLAIGALTWFAAWTLASGGWAGADVHAILEFNRALLYLLVFVLCACLGGTSGRLRTALLGVAGGIVVVCGAAFISRALPEILPTDPNPVSSRLSYPLDYWNALGLLASLGIVLCLHLASSSRERAVTRVLGGAALPMLAATLLLTFSRGSIAVAIVGTVVYCLLARTRSLLTTLPVVVPLTGLAVLQTYNAELLADEPTSAAAVAEGTSLAWGVGGCVLSAAVLMVAVIAIDRRLAPFALPARAARVTRWLVPAGAVVAVLAVGLAVDLPGRVSEQYDRFVEADSLVGKQQRDRLTDVANNGRLDHWTVALEGYEQDHAKGAGAGTYQLLWARERPGLLTVSDAHSLYLEVMAELGLVGLVLLVVAIVSILVGLAMNVRGRDRALYAAVFAATLAWALHAGVDWDWEMPAVTVWLFGLAGLALAGRSRGATRPKVNRAARVAGAVACLVAAIAPVLVVVSQRNLNESVRAFKDDDCPRAIDSALASRGALPARPEPFQMLGFCDSRLGRGDLAIRVMRQAVDRDPDNWEFHYSLALVTAAAGDDPRPAARAALRLNPRSPLTRDAVRRFAKRNPARWRRYARRAPLPFQQ